MSSPGPSPKLPPVPDPHGPGLISLTPQKCGYWSKKHKGKRYYFARLEDPDLAIDEYIRRWPQITTAGDQPSLKPTTISAALAEYLADAERRHTAGEIGHSRLQLLTRLARLVTSHFGGRRTINSISAIEWAEAMRDLFSHKGPVTRHLAIQTTRTMLRWCERNCGVEIDAGDAFRPVPARVRRRHRREHMPGMFTAGEIRRLIKVCRSLHDHPHADAVTTEACLWLAINGGMRQSEIAQLTPRAYRRCDRVDRGVRGWIDEPRPKTESPRRFPLWPETADAIDAALSLRRHPDFLLATRNDTPLLTPNNDRLLKRFDALKRRAWPNADSPHRRCTFSWFRTTQITVASTAPVTRPDLARIVRRVIAGHVINDVHDGYIRSLPDEPFIETCLHVRHWLLRV